MNHAPSERRATVGVELRAAPPESNSPGTLVGYPIVYGRRSEVLTDPKTKRSFVEVVKAGAPSRSIREHDVRALVDHDPSKVIGRNRAGTLRMVEDDHGTRCEVDLPDTTAGRDVAVSVSRGDLTGMSFGFRVAAGGESWDLSGSPALRSLDDIDVDDVSVVAYPAYPDTSVALRSLDAASAAAAAEVPETETEIESPAGDVAGTGTARRELDRDRDRLRMLGL